MEIKEEKVIKVHLTANQARTAIVRYLQQVFDESGETITVPTNFYPPHKKAKKLSFLMFKPKRKFKNNFKTTK